MKPEDWKPCESHTMRIRSRLPYDRDVVLWQASCTECGMTVMNVEDVDHCWTSREDLVTAIQAAGATISPPLTEAPTEEVPSACPPPKGAS